MVTPESRTEIASGICGEGVSREHSRRYFAKRIYYTVPTDGLHFDQTSKFMASFSLLWSSQHLWVHNQCSIQKMLIRFPFTPTNPTIESLTEKLKICSSIFDTCFLLHKLVNSAAQFVPDKFDRFVRFLMISNFNDFCTTLQHNFMFISKNHITVCIL